MSLANGQFTRKAIGTKVYIAGHGDLAMDGELRGFIFEKTPLLLIGISKRGKAKLQSEDGKIYTVRTENVCPINEI